MTSQAKIDANRRNAAKSTGPRTEDGKKAIRLNALKHGLAARDLILFDETEAEFEGFHDELHDSFAPADAAECALVERIAVLHWRLRRVWRAEAAAFNSEARGRRLDRLRRELHAAMAAELEKNPPDGKPITMDQAKHLAWAGIEAMPQAAIDDMLAEDDCEPPPTLASLDVWPERRLADLSRYETAIERQLHRLLLDLDRLQQRRRQRIEDATALKKVKEELRHKAAAREAERAAELAALQDHPMRELILRTNPKFADAAQDSLPTAAGATPEKVE